MKSVLLLGKGSLAVQVGEWFDAHEDYRVEAVVPVIPEPDWESFSLSMWAERAFVPIVTSGDYRDASDVVRKRSRGTGLAWDLVLSVFYDRILDPVWIAAQGRCLNIHNGPLPRYRGVNPINWALKNGESSHGVTIHEIDEGVDTGPIVASLGYSIYPDDEVEEVYRRALAYGWTLFEQTMPILDRITPRPQHPHDGFGYTKADADKLGDRSDWRRP